MRFHLDYFGTSLEDLKARDQGDRWKVKAILRREGKFSSFIGTKLGMTIADLVASGDITCTNELAYPWVGVVVNDTDPTEAP